MPKPGNGTTTVPIDGISLGLNTKDRATSLVPGAASRADNAWLYRGNLASCPGYKRVTNALPREPAFLLNGKDQMFQSERLATGSEFSLNTTDWSVGVTFESSGMAEIQTILFKGSGDVLAGTGTVAGIDWAAVLTINAGKVNFIWFLSNGTTFKLVTHTTVTTAGTADMSPNTTYRAVLTYDDSDTGQELKGYIFEPGQDSGTPVTSAKLTGAPQDVASYMFVGGQPLSPAAIVKDYQVSQFHFQGVIQEFAIWDSVLDGATITSDAVSQVASTASVIGYSMTGGSGSVIDDDTGIGQPLYIEPTRVRWSQTGLADASGKSVLFDGVNDLLVIPDTYRYRQPAPDGDGEYPAYLNWFVALSVRVGGLVDHATIIHSAHVQKSTYLTNHVSATVMNGTVSLSGQQAQWMLEIAEDATHAGEYEFRWVVWLEDSASPAVVTAHAVSSNLSTGSGGGISTSTTYHILLKFDTNSGSPILKLFLNGANSNSSPDSLSITPGTSPAYLLNTANDPVGSATKYLTVLGCAISHSRMGNRSYGDPNDIEWKPKGDRYFTGQIDQLVIGSGVALSSTTSVWLGNFLKETYLDRLTVASLSGQVLSAWLFNEGEGDLAEDIGQQGNHLALKTDPEHRRANSRIETAGKGRVYGVIDQEYRTPTGTVRKVLAVHSGGIAEVNESTKSLDHLYDGIRNDDGVAVSVDRWRDTAIICTGDGPNMSVWRDQLHKLSIDPPSGFVPWGVADQVEPESAGKKPGRYRWGFTFYSAFQDKRSALGVEGTIDLKADANFVFGTDAEMLQTHAETAFSDKSPFDLTVTTKKKAWLRLQAWLETGTSGSPEDGPAGADPDYIKVKFTDASGLKNHWIEHRDSVKAEEVQNAVQFRAKRCWVETYSDGSLKIKSRFLGSQANLVVLNAGGSGSNNTTNAIFGATTPTITPGSGVTGHGIGLPTTDDLQVTHLEYWCSLADDEDLRLVARYPIGTTTFKDVMPDELNVGEVLDTSLIAIPPCRYVVPFGARRLFFGDPLQPQRLYIAEQNMPWAARIGALVDFTDHRKLGLTMAIGSEDNIILCKRDSTMVLVPNYGQAIPFQVFTRFRNSGADAAFGAVDVDGIAMWPEEDGIMAYDTSRPVPLSEAIDDTYDEISASLRSEIRGIHWKGQSAAGWSAHSGDTLVSGASVHDHILWYFYQTGVAGGKLHGWVKQTAINAAMLSIIEDDNGIDRVWFVDCFGYIHEMGSGNYAGNWDGSAVLTTATLACVSGTNNTTHVTLTKANAQLPDGYKGFWISVVDATDGTMETRFVVSDTQATPSVLTLDHALSFTPAVGDVVYIGLIPFHWETGDMSLAGQDKEAHTLRIHATMKAQASGSFELGWKATQVTNEPTDFSTATIDATSTVLQKGTMDNSRAKRHRLRIRATTPGVAIEIEELGLETKALGTGSYKGTTT